MMITGQMDSGKMAFGFDGPDVQAWANYMLQVNAIDVTFAADQADEILSIDSRHPELYSWNYTIDGVEVPLVRWGQCLLRPHNCYPSDIPVLWDFLEHYSFEKAEDGTITRYYSPSAFAQDDAVKLS